MTDRHVNETDPPPLRANEQEFIQPRLSNSAHDKDSPYRGLGPALLVGTFIATSLAAYYTGSQADIARDQERRSLRAYVIVSSDSISNFSKGGMAEVQAKFENVGQTPVYQGFWASGINVAPYPLKSGLLHYHSCNTMMSEATGERWFFGKVSYPFKNMTVPFNEVDIEQIKLGRSAIFFTGRLCYRDIFNDLHHTDFCIQWRGSGNGLRPAEYCGIGNDSDR